MTEVTHGGARVIGPPDAFSRLTRSVMSCMLWEGEFYEDGQSIADRIQALVAEVDPEQVAAIAVEARTNMNLRHVPLLLAVTCARLKSHRKVVRSLLPQIIQRADELAEFLAIYWKDGGGDRRKSKHKLAKGVQRGLADAFGRFKEYDLAKYNQDGAIKLKDVLFLSHAKPTGELDALWKKLIDDKLAVPDTWETSISATKGREAGKKEEWTRLLRERKLGSLALIRNLRNMEQAGVDHLLIRDAIRGMKVERVLPFRYVAAAHVAPRFEAELSDAMLRSVADLPKLPGHTVLVVDVSGSMYSGQISIKSDLNRAYAAAALAALAREVCGSVDLYATAGSDSRQKHQTQLVPARRGLPLVDAIYALYRPLGGGGIFLKQCMDYVWEDRKRQPADRVIVITDGQDTDRSHKGTSNITQIAPRQYIINVASSKTGIGYGAWLNIDGWSERVLDYIRVYERLDIEGAQGGK